MSRWILLTVFFLYSVSCKKKPEIELYHIADEWKARLLFEEPRVVSSRLQVRMGQTAFGFKKESDVNAFLSSHLNSRWLTTQVKPNSKTLMYFKESPSTIAIVKVPNSQSLDVLFTPQNIGELDHIGSLLHNEEGFGCGRVQSLQLMTASESASLFGSVHLSTAKIGAVDNMIKVIEKERLKNLISEISSEKTRLHSSDSGLQFPSKLETMIRREVGSQASGLKFDFIDHSATGRTTQKSLVVTLGTPSEEPSVILGAHIDTISLNDDAPGADDDASGIATLVETMRVIVQSEMKFSRPIEFHFYAAEEVGLIGSSDLAEKYAFEDKKVASMMQVDMNAFSSEKNKNTIFFISTDTNKNLTRSLKNLANTYLEGDFEEKPLGTGTSDHKSWMLAGYQVAFPFEDPENYNRKLHTSDDNMDQLNNFELTERFVGLAIAYIAHWAGVKDSQLIEDTEVSDDLKVAIVEGDQSNEWDLVVAAEKEKVRSIEYCLASESGVCTADRRRLAGSSRVGTRQFFVSEDTFNVDATVDNIFVNLFGYDENDREVARRQVSAVRK